MTNNTFVDAIQNARTMIDYGIELGFNMNILDIGGGFPGNTGTENCFSAIAVVINRTLEEYFPTGSNIRVIAEPGRYYVASAYTLATNVIASREMIDSGWLIDHIQYRKSKEFFSNYLLLFIIL